MSPRKLTEDDKQEILQLYRNSEATTSTLAERYEVSSSTISRFLKNKLSSTEYEDLIQQKRLARTPRGETTNKAKKETKQKKTTTKAKKTTKKSLSKIDLDSTQTAETTVAVSKLEPSEIIEPAVSELESAEVEPETFEPKSTEVEPETSEPEITETEPKSIPQRRRRRRSSVSDESESLDTVTTETELEQVESDDDEPETEEKPAKLIIDRKARETSAEDESDKSSKNNLILKSDKPNIVTSSSLEDDDDDDDDENEMDLITLKEMLGEDLEDINDEEDEEEDDDWDEEEATLTYSKKDTNFSDVEILPLSQAIFPGTCYLVIDRSAELIVKPLAEFADLGEIPQDEVRQRTLPVFDNHRIAKRFSHRRERVIKVPDGRMLQKTSHYLQEKGITRLLIDGQIYSLLN